MATWGTGPVGLFAIASARLLGAERIIAIDRYPERLRLAQEQWQAETLNYEDVDDVFDQTETDDRRPRPRSLHRRRGDGRTHGGTADAIYDKVKQAIRLQFDSKRSSHAPLTASNRVSRRR